MRVKSQIIAILINSGYPESIARYLVAVSAFETGNWKSEVYKRNHNLFGMRMPEIRRTTAIGDVDQDGYANYASNADSAKDMVFYLRWFDYKYFYVDLYDFVRDMKVKGYFEADFNTYYLGVRTKYMEIFKTLG